MIIDIASLWSSFENAAGLMLSRHAVSVSIRTSMRILTMCLQTAILLRSIQRQDSKDAVPIHWNSFYLVCPAIWIGGSKNTGISYYPAAEGHIFPFKDRLPSHPLETIPELYSIGQNSACASKPYHRLRLCSRSRETQLFWRFGQNKGSSRFSVVIIHQLSVRLRSWKLMLGSHRHEKECGSCIRQLEECYLMRLV